MLLEGLRVAKVDIFVENLTNQEKNVLKLVSEGKTDKGIAETLFVSVPTIRTHLRNLYNKFGIIDAYDDKFNPRVLLVLESLKFHH